MLVYNKGVAAGATWPLAWTTFQRLHPQEAKQLEVRFPTEPLVNQGIDASQREGQGAAGAGAGHAL